jgi:hypothetical protein
MSESSTHPIRFDWVERAREYLKPLAAGAPSAPTGERGARGIVSPRWAGRFVIGNKVFPVTNTCWAIR